MIDFNFPFIGRCAADLITPQAQIQKIFTVRENYGQSTCNQFPRRVATHAGKQIGKNAGRKQKEASAKQMVSGANQMVSGSNQMVSSADQMFSAANQMLSGANRMVSSANQMVSDRN
jgi:X-X-X-Leu-X-X-Gly heptad repeat protein